MSDNNGRRTRTSPTLRRILKNASEEFAEHGFAGARMDRIARRAGVNKAALYYHVGDKESLFESVLFGVFSDIEHEIEKSLEGIIEPAERLGAFICTYAGIVSRNKHLSNLLLRAFASGFRNFPGEIVKIMDGLFDTYQEIVNQGKRAGVFRNDFNPAIGYAMVMGSLHIMKADGTLCDNTGQNGFSYAISIEGQKGSVVGLEIARNLIAATSI